MVSSGSMRCRKAWLLFECCCSTFLYLSETLNVVAGLLALGRVRIGSGQDQVGMLGTGVCGLDQGERLFGQQRIMASKCFSNRDICRRLRLFAV